MIQPTLQISQEGYQHHIKHQTFLSSREDFSDHPTINANLVQGRHLRATLHGVLSLLPESEAFPPLSSVPHCSLSEHSAQHTLTPLSALSKQISTLLASQDG